MLVEKPMAVTVEECEAMIDACHRGGVKLMVAFMKRFDPSLQWVKSLIDVGELGFPFIVNSWYYDTVHHGEYVAGFTEKFVRTQGPIKKTPTFEADLHLNVLLTHGVHHMDLLHWIGGDVEAVSSSFKQFDGNYVSTSILEYKSGSLGYYQLAGNLTKDWDEALIVHGTKGSAQVKIRFPYFKERSEAQVYLYNTYQSSSQRGTNI